MLVKLYRPLDGRKELAGTLAAYDASTGAVTVALPDGERTLEKKEIALARLRVEF